jgi:hypothetical protein
MKTDIEYAALVMGDAVKYKELVSSRIEFGLIKHTKHKGFYVGPRPFDPEHDDGDSRRLEIACLNWIGRVIECPKSVTLAYAEFTGFICGAIDIQPEQYRAAVFALAAAIGKVIDGGGV